MSEIPVARGGTTALVPTMGALHEGHLALVRQAKRECDLCVTSIFVNPSQFGPGEDFDKYPRQEAKDLELLDSADVDFALVPTVEEMYRDPKTRIYVSGVSERWEGAHRPGHFEGVATVVAKLFGLVQPDCAYFGLKDLQQCAVISKMVTDLNFRVTLRFMETVREEDGLALSSRNRYLSEEARRRAPRLYQALQAAACELRTSRLELEDLTALLGRYKSDLGQSGFDVDYLALVDVQTMEPLPRPSPNSRLIVAARLGATRLIDNCPVE